jgi:hypothetical protein
VRDFNKPIASIAFSLDGGCVLVASGHRLTYWKNPEYQARLREQLQQQQMMMIDNEANNPRRTPERSQQQQQQQQQQPIEESKETVNILLKTKRSLRCALFRPRGLPLILTAEVSDDMEPTPGGSAINMGAANIAVTGLSYTGPSPFVAVQMPSDLESGVYVARGFRGNFNSDLNQLRHRNFAAGQAAAAKMKKEREEASKNNDNPLGRNKAHRKLRFVFNNIFTVSLLSSIGCCCCCCCCCCDLSGVLLGLFASLSIIIICCCCSCSRSRA